MGWFKPQQSWGGIKSCWGHAAPRGWDRGRSQHLPCDTQDRGKGRSPLGVPPGSVGQHSSTTQTLSSAWVSAPQRRQTWCSLLIGMLWLESLQDEGASSSPAPPGRAALRGILPPPWPVQGVNPGCCTEKKGESSLAYKNTSIAHSTVRGPRLPTAHVGSRLPRGARSGARSRRHGRAEAVLGRLQRSPVPGATGSRATGLPPPPADRLPHPCSGPPPAPSGLQVVGEPQQLLLAVDGSQVLQVRPGGDRAPHAQGLLRACRGEPRSGLGSCLRLGSPIPPPAPLAQLANLLHHHWLISWIPLHCLLPDSLIRFHCCWLGSLIPSITSSSAHQTSLSPPAWLMDPYLSPLPWLTDPTPSPLP